MADSKAILIANIKDWVLINNEMTKLQKQVKELRNKKKTISNVLIEIMEKNEIDGIDINDGKLLYKKNKIKGAINKEYLLSTLNDYFKKYPDVDTNDVSSFILENRPIKEKQTILIKQTK